MNKLDLHGIHHEEVDRIVENYVFLNELPVEIITGNSDKMINIVKDVLERNEFEYTIGDYYNRGYITVYNCIEMRDRDLVYLKVEDRNTILYSYIPREGDESVVNEGYFFNNINNVPENLLYDGFICGCEDFVDDLPGRSNVMYLGGKFNIARFCRYEKFIEFKRNHSIDSII